MQHFERKTTAKYLASAVTLAVIAWLPGASQARGDLPEGLMTLPLVEQGLVGVGKEGEVGGLYEIDRPRRKGVDTEKLDLLPSVKLGEEPGRDLDEQVPSIDQLKGKVQFEYFDIDSGRSFAYLVDRQILAKYSRGLSQEENQNTLADKRPEGIEIELEEGEKRWSRSWSNATDNRTRRSATDGYSDTNSIYQNLANFGGCSATVLSANWSRLVAITAAHCIFNSSYQFTNSKVDPRRDNGVSPTWGQWSPYVYGYYPSYISEDCENNFRTACIKHDIALVVASRDAGAVPPSGMGWGYQPKNYLDSHSKYRRGYPGCGNVHSPAGCNTNTLYGDGSMTVGSFRDRDSDNWNRRIKFSSDINPGDSGSGLYYYDNGQPYVFAVTSAEPSNCKTSCSSSRPNSARRITPQFFDFINTIVASY